MQMRSCAMWLSVMGLVLIATPAWAAPKKKHHKAAETESSEPEPAPVEKAKPKDVDDLMNDAPKRSAASTSSASSEPEEKASAEVGEPDAWERPPAEEEKPKRKKVVEVAEVKKGDGRNMNIGVLAGYGFWLGAGFAGFNPYGLGFGLQGDYELESHLVLGVGGEFFLGTSTTSANAIGGSAGYVEATYYRYVLGHALVGYNIWLSDTLILRPSIWVGAAFGLLPPSPRALNGYVFSLMLAPGLSLHYILGKTGWYLGADVRFSMPLGHDGATGLPVLATFGKRF